MELAGHDGRIAVSDEVIRIRGTSYLVVDCITCGVIYTVHHSVAEEYRRNGGYYHCPNGHRQGWTKEGSETERLRRERDRLTQRVAEKDDDIARLNRVWSAAEERATVERKVRLRIEKRIHNGTCPDCNRSFSNLQRHMATKHSPPKLVLVAS